MNKVLLIVSFLVTTSCFAGINILFDGNSLTAGVGATQVNGDFFDYPVQTMRILAVTHPVFSYYNSGVSGQTVDDMAGDASTEIDARFSATDTNVVVVWEGTNQMGLSGTSGADTYTKIRNYCLARKAANSLFKVVVLTTIPNPNQCASGGSCYFEVERNALNALLRQHWAEFADAMADVGDLSGYTYADGTHLDNNGYSIVAGKVASTVNALLAGNSGGHQFLPVKFKHFRVHLSSAILLAILAFYKKEEHTPKTLIQCTISNL